MSKPRKRKGKSKFVKLDAWLIKSEAYSGLSFAAMALYTQFLMRYDGFNNGRIGFGCREAATALNSNRDTMSKAFKQLEAHGFIETKKKSGFSVKNRLTAEYRLTAYSCDVTGQLPTKEFMNWVPKKKQQSVQTDTQSAHTDSKPTKSALSAPHSQSRLTVKPKSAISQSVQTDTYIYNHRGYDPVRLATPEVPDNLVPQIVELPIHEIQASLSQFRSKRTA